jgi:glycosyltransferase involved in cell wall biosynthesis
VDATAVSLLEAMACGRAIIVSDLPSATEWIEDGDSGLVVAPRDEAGLAAAMLRFAHDAQLRQRCGERALAVAREHADFASNMENVAGIFRSLVSGAGDWPAAVVLSQLAPEARGKTCI